MGVCVCVCNGYVCVMGALHAGGLTRTPCRAPACACWSWTTKK